MNFMLVNDDGIEAAGIKALAEALAEVGDVYVCAPAFQQSGKSHSITLMGTVKVEEAYFPGAVKAYKTSGTPADCTRIGLQLFEDSGAKIDIVFSGVNTGSNLGDDTLYSGTVGAAMEAALMGHHGVAVSVSGHGASHFEGACKLAVDVIPFIKKDLPTDIILNINTPDVEMSQLKGIKYPPLGPSVFIDYFSDNGGTDYELIGHERTLEILEPHVDVAENLKGYATITPLLCDFTDHKRLGIVEKWGLNI